MATTGKNTVSLVVEAGVTGEADIRRLADDVRRLAKEGGDAAPEFAALAAQLDRLGDQAAALATFKELSAQAAVLATAQTEAAAAAQALGNRLTEAKDKAQPYREEQARLALAVRDAEVEVSKAKGALDTYVAGFTKADKDTAAFVLRQAELKGALAGAKTELLQQEQALKILTPALAAAAAEERKLAAQYEAQQARVDAANEALRRRNAALNDAQAVALAAGVSTTELAAAELLILESSQKAAAATQRLTTERQQAAAAAVELAALDEQAVQVQQRLLAQLERTSQQYEKDRADELAAIETARQKRVADYAAIEASAAKAAALRLAAEAAQREATASKSATEETKRLAAEADQAEADFRALEASIKQAAEAEERLVAAEGAAAMKRLEDAAKQADAEFRELTGSLRTAEAAATEFAAASERVASATKDDAAAIQQRLAAAERLVASERELTVAQREMIAQRNAGRVALVAEAEALLRVAAAARETQAATTATAVAARQAGEAITQAFGAVGIRSIDAIQAEIEQTSRALSRLETASRQGALGQDELARAAGAAEVKIARLRAEILQVQSTPSQFTQMADGINNLITRFAGLGAAIATVGIAVKPVLDATIALEQMRRVLTQVTGSAEIAEQQIAFLRRTATESGQSFSEIGQSYSKFAASALQSGLSLKQVDDVFRSVSLAAGNLGLSSDQAKRALEALSQIASKGTVSMEELRQQLGDALPGVLPLLSKELGLTQRELIKVVESGQLLASEAIPAIGRALSSLQPADGIVNGLVASWNRFKNVVLEAGTAIVEGPLGQAAGVVVTAFAGALRDVAVVAVSASEAFKLLGLSVVTTLDALAGNISFKEAGKRISEFAETAGARISAFKETAYGADEALAKLGKTAGFTGDSFAKLTLEQQKAIDAATLAAQSAEKGVQAAKAEAEAITRLAGLLGDETAQREASVAASQKVLQATEAQLRADEAQVASLVKLREQTLLKAGSDQTALEGVKALIEETDKKIAKGTADVEKTRAQVDAARAFASAQQLAAEAARDNSGRLVELRAAVEEASGAYVTASRRYAEGKASLDAVKVAADALARAKGLLRDAINDLDKALKNQINTLKADLDIKRAGLELDLAQARNMQRLALEKGNENAARQAGIRIAEIEQALRRTGTSGTLQEAEATLKYVAAKEAELRASGQLTPEIEKELELLRKQALATTLKTQAQIETNKADDENLARLQGKLPALDAVSTATDRATSSTASHTAAVRSNSAAQDDNAKSTNVAADATSRYNRLLLETRGNFAGGSGLSGIGPSQDGTNFGVRSPGTAAGNDAQGNLPKIDSFNDLFNATPNGGVTRTAGGQLQPPDNSGDWVLDTSRKGEGAFGLGVWVKKGQEGGVGVSAAGFGGVPFGFGGNQFGFTPVNPPAETPAPAPAAATSYTVNVTIGGKSYGIGATSKDAADALIASLEEAYRAGGGQP